MATERTLSVKIVGDPKSLSRAFNQVDKDVSRFERSTVRAKKAMAGMAKAGVLAGAAVTAAFAGVGTREAIAQEKASARTANVLKTTAGVANVTAKEIHALSAAIQEQTGTADDAIQSSANLLLTFTKVRDEVGKGNDVFSQAVPLINDMAVALGTDLNGATIQVGKALNDPIKGVTALGRAGVSFTQQQRDQIKALQESGRTMEAQKIILSELAVQFGGAASSEGKTTEATQKLQRQFEDASEAVMVKLLPALTKLADWIATEVIPKAQQVVDYFQRHWPTIEKVVRDVSARIRADLQALTDWIDANVIPTIESLRRNWNRLWSVIGDDVEDTFRLINNIVGRQLRILRDAIETVLALIRGDWADAWKNLRQVVKGAFDLVKVYLLGIPKQVARTGLTIGKAIAGGIKDGILSIRDEIIDAIWSLIPAPLRRFLRGGGDGGTQVPGSAEDRIVNPPGSGGGGGGGNFGIGGRIPGRQGQAVPITAHAGEVILNREQQRRVGIVRIVEALRSTGGRMGGASFARGGYVNPFPGGNWAGGPSAHGSRALGNWQSDNAWDIMGAAGSPVYAVLPGTIGRVSASDSRGQFAGQGVYLDTADGQWWYKHIAASVSPGQRVNAGDQIGTLVSWTNGGPHLHLATATGDPARARSGAAPDLVRSMASFGNAPGAGETTPPTLSPFQALRRLLGGSAAVARRVIGAGQVGGVSDSLSTSLTSGQSRGVALAGRRAASAARGMGKSPDQIADAQREAERKAEKNALIRNMQGIEAAAHKLRKLKADLLIDLQKLRKAKGMRPGAKRAAARRVRTAVKQITNEIGELLDMRAEINARLAEIGEEQAAEWYQANYDAAQAAGEAAAEQEAFKDALIDAAAAEAALTPGLSDDLAVARDAEGLAQQRLDAARASGDPVRIAEAARALLSARQNREQIEATIANTDAVNANTDALKQSFGGTTTFGFRGQDYVLRSLAPPSSDRLVGLEVGIA